MPPRVGIGWFVAQRLTAVAPPGTLYGNVEIRQVDLSFNAEGTVVAMPKREGDPVRQGELIAELDAATYQSTYDLATARRDAAKARLDVLLAGTRPEQIDQARANVAAAQASLANAEATYERQLGLAARDASTKQLLDDARMALDAAAPNWTRCRPRSPKRSMVHGLRTLPPPAPSCVPPRRPLNSPRRSSRAPS